MIRHSSYAILVAALLSASGCNAMTATKADRCVLVDLQGQQGQQLVPLLDALATNLGLDADKSHPVNLRYTKHSADGLLEAEIGYRTNLGRFGAGLSLFRYETTRNADLVEQFDHFVEHTVAPKYAVTPCAPEQYPTTYR